MTDSQPVTISKKYLALDIADVPSQPGWLDLQAQPVIAIGKGDTNNADVIVSDEKDLSALITSIDQHPIAAMALVQVLRVIEKLPIAAGMTVESLAYATLQAGSEFRSWLSARKESPYPVIGGEGDPVLIQRENNIVYAQLNRPTHRNSLTIEMRNALVELFELILVDDSIERVNLSGLGSCFCVGGELREFGLTSNVAAAHQIRSIHNPSRLLAQCAARVSCYLHSACIGSGIEIPAFAGHVVAASKTFFQLPELSFGLIPGAGGCVSLSNRIGRKRTAWLALSGRKINAHRALDWGLIDEIRDE